MDTGNFWHVVSAHVDIVILVLLKKDDTYTNLFQNIVIVISIFNIANIETIIIQNTDINTKCYMYDISTKIWEVI